MTDAVAAGQRFYMEFVFKAEDDYGTFYMCYGEVDEEPVEDFDEFIAALEPFSGKYYYPSDFASLSHLP